jgi:hypothetical protein
MTSSPQRRHICKEIISAKHVCGGEIYKAKEKEKGKRRRKIGKRKGKRKEKKCFTLRPSYTPR